MDIHALKQVCPFYVTRPGFEPRPSEPESEILPLYYRAIRSANV